MELLKKIAFISFLIFLFFLPFNQTWTNIFWFISAFGVLVNKDLYKNFNLSKLRIEEKNFIFFSSCYGIWCFISLLWSDDLNSGLQLSGRYIIIMLFPIFITLARIGGVIKKFEILGWSFVAGVLVSSFACLYLSYQDCWYESSEGMAFSFDIWHRNISVYESFSTGFSCFTYSFLSHFLNPAYYSMCFIFVFVLLINKLCQVSKFGMKILMFLGLLYVAVFLLLLQCRAELIGWGVIIVLFLFIYCLKNNYYKTLIVGFIGLIVVGLVIVPHTRFDGLIDGAKKLFEPLEEQEINISWDDKNQRVFLWKNAIEVIKQHPILGVGVGDADLAMRQENEKSKFPNITLGTHNQYLYSWLSLGFFGLLFLLAMLLTLLYYGIKNRYFPLLGFSIALMIGIMFENMLTRNAGLMFIPWATMLLLMMSEEKKNELAK